jgi:hypothetical protein
MTPLPVNSLYGFGTSSYDSSFIFSFIPFSGFLFIFPKASDTICLLFAFGPIFYSVSGWHFLHIS